jgi:hypothetical protein
MPPADYGYLGGSSQPYNASNYNVYGRAYHLEISYRGHRWYLARPPGASRNLLTTSRTKTTPASV